MGIQRVVLCGLLSKDIQTGSKDLAAVQTFQALKDLRMPEVDWFMENCLEAFSLNIDQL